LLFFVIPVAAEIKFFDFLQKIWTPLLAGMTTFYQAFHKNSHIKRRKKWE